MTNAAIHSCTPMVASTPSFGEDSSIDSASWRGILAVEPDIAVLHTGSLLLTKSNYCVTPAASDGELFVLRNIKTIGLAILSDRLGQRLLGTVASLVRRQWPRTRILILGQVPLLLDDHLYDEHIHRSPDPGQVLGDLERLYRGMWNRRTNSIDWNAARSALRLARPPVSESAPAEVIAPASKEDPCNSLPPSEIRIPNAAFDSFARFAARALPKTAAA